MMELCYFSNLRSVARHVLRIFLWWAIVRGGGVGREGRGLKWCGFKKGVVQYIFRRFGPFHTTISVIQYPKFYVGKGRVPHNTYNIKIKLT